MSGWTRWQQGAGFSVCHNRRLGLEAEATLVGNRWRVEVFRGSIADGDYACAIARTLDEARQLAIAKLPRRHGKKGKEVNWKATDGRQEKQEKAVKR